MPTIIKRNRPFTVCDPCCGSGGLILNVAQEFAPVEKGGPSDVDLIRATCIDLNPVAVYMCYINTSLWGIPASVFCGNMLTMEMRNGWKNIHWMRVWEDSDTKRNEWFLVVGNDGSENRKRRSLRGEYQNMEGLNTLELKN